MWYATGIAWIVLGIMFILIGAGYSNKPEQPKKPKELSQRTEIVANKYLPIEDMHGKSKEALYESNKIYRNIEYEDRWEVETYEAFIDDKGNADIKLIWTDMSFK